MIISKAIIPAGGRGTRFLPVSRVVPKEMLPVLDKPSIQYVVEEAYEAGFSYIIIVIGKNKSLIQDHFKDCFQNVTYVLQNEPKGLGHAVWVARHNIGNEYFAVLLPDDILIGSPAIGQLAKMAFQYNSSVIAVQETAESELSNYGVVHIGKVLSSNLMELAGIVEKPKAGTAPSNLAVVGRYILSPTIFDILEKQKFDLSGEIQLTDAISKLLLSERVLACKVEGLRYDTGTPMGLLKASLGVALGSRVHSDGILQHLGGLRHETRI